jgi:hypothetical protein
MSGAKHEAPYFTPRFLRAGCFSKRDERDVANALLVKAGGDEAEALMTVIAVREWATAAIRTSKRDATPD